MAHEEKPSTASSRPSEIEAPGYGWRSLARDGWAWARLLSALVAAAWVVDATHVNRLGAWIVGPLAFGSAWVALSLLGVAVRHPGTTALLLVSVVAVWLGLSWLSSLPVATLLVIVIVLLLFR